MVWIVSRGQSDLELTLLRNTLTHGAGPPHQVRSAQGSHLLTPLAPWPFPRTHNSGIQPQ